MLNEMKNHIEQIWFNWKVSISRLQSFDIENIEWRFKLLKDILQYTDSIGIELIDWNSMYNLLTINQSIANCFSYSTNLKIIAFNLSNILTLLSYEFIKENSNKFDYDILKKYLNWQVPLSDFIKEPSEINKNNVIWNFVWKDSVKYSWQWVKDLVKLNWLDIENILTNIETDDFKLKNTIEMLYSKEHDYNIKKEYKSIRWAWLSLLKSILDPNEESKLISILNK